MLRMPRESGIYSIWIASLVFAARRVSSAGLGLPVGAALLGSIIMLPATEYARSENPGARLAALGLAASPYLLVLAYTWPHSLPAAAVGAVLLYFSLRLQALRVVVGGGLVAFHGTMLALAGGMPLIDSLLPIPYATLGSAEAFIRISGSSKPALLAEALCMAMVLLYAVLYPGIPSPAGLAIILDVSARILMRITGFSARMPLKAYGVLEFLRLTIVLGVAGASS